MKTVQQTLAPVRTKQQAKGQHRSGGGPAHLELLLGKAVEAATIKAIFRETSKYKGRRRGHKARLAVEKYGLCTKIGSCYYTVPQDLAMAVIMHATTQAGRFFYKTNAYIAHAGNLRGRKKYNQPIVISRKVLEAMKKSKAAWDSACKGEK